MVSLTDLALVLGGTLRHGHLETRIGGLAAAVVYRPAHDVPCEVTVLAANASARDPVVRHGAEWHLVPPRIPSLDTGFVFVGCRAGRLVARSFAPPTAEQVIGALRELAAWARLPWQPPRPDDDEAEHDRRAYLREQLVRLGVAVAVAVAVFLLRRR
ncbi:MAG: hypothetical protein KF773_05440 [Deltaproteobacteria bacterium]|nr:hypothetical protein [Deltaproteobacteria bacterium]